MIRRHALNRRSFIASGAALGAAAVLGSCGAQPDAAPAAEDAAAAPTRVIALATGHLDHCLALGVLPVGLAVAVSDATASRGVPQFLQDAFSDQYDLNSITVVGERGEPDLEKVASLKPDLILSNQRSPEQINDALAQIAPTVLTIGGSEGFKEDLGIVGDALGMRQEADRMLADYEQRARDWGTARGTTDSISLVRARGEEYLYFGTRALASIVAADAGLTRPESQRFDDKPSRELSLERVDVLDADWIFYAHPGGENQLTTNELWNELPAVTADRAFEVDIDPWFLNASIVAANRVLADMQQLMA